MLSADLAWPNRLHGDCLITFATTFDVQENLGPASVAAETTHADTLAFIQEGAETLDIAAFDARNIVSDLIRQAWEAELTRRGLIPHTLASGLNAWFFAHNHLKFNRAFLRPAGIRRTYRQLVGTKSKRTSEGIKVPDGYWHYALSASPQLLPVPRLVLRHHVIFTDDGRTAWASIRRMVRARRGVCRNWWNAEWRDRLFAYCNELSNEAPTIQIPVGAGEAIVMDAVPMSFISPWTYFEDHNGGMDENAEIELVEESDDDDDDDAEDT